MSKMSLFGAFLHEQRFDNPPTTPQSGTKIGNWRLPGARSNHLHTHDPRQLGVTLPSSAPRPPCPPVTWPSSLPFWGSSATLLASPLGWTRWRWSWLISEPYLFFIDQPILARSRMSWPSWWWSRLFCQPRISGCSAHPRPGASHSSARRPPESGRPTQCAWG